MSVDDITAVAADGTSLLKMIATPLAIRRANSQIIRSREEAKKAVDLDPNPSYILSNEFFVCNKPYESLLNKFGCPVGPIGVRQLNNIQKVLDADKIDYSKIDLDKFDFEAFMKIIDSIRFVSDDVLVNAWNKLLKNTIENNEQYSQRTLMQLSRISPEEALLFDSYSRFIVREKDYYYLICESCDSGKRLMDLDVLIEAGFVSSEAMYSTNAGYYWNNYYVKFDGDINFRKITKFGKDIYELMCKNMTLNDHLEQLKTLNDNCCWSLHLAVNDHQYVTSPIAVKEKK